MRTEVVLKYLGIVLLLNSVMLFVSCLVSISYNETSTLPLLFSTLICVILGVFPLIFVERVNDITFNEGLAIVVFGWLITCVVGMLPYIMWGGEFSVINAWFESVSGFTTTGATILTEVESLPLGLLLWRSSTHWLGGIGIIVFVLLVLPGSRNPRLKLLNTELSELSKSNFNYTARRTIMLLALVYFALTVTEISLLKIAGMPLFDAIAHSFATVATGGFSTRNLSVAHFDSLSIELIIVSFMVISGIHFGLIFATIAGKKDNIFTSRVVRAYLLILGIGVILVGSTLYFSNVHPLWHSMRTALFQVASVGTTTGFATEDTGYWPGFSQLVLMYFTIQCAMVGSTSGGLKFDRVYIFFKTLGKQIRLMRHPKAVITLRIDKRTIDESLEKQVLVFIVLYVFTFFVTTALLSAMGVDLMTAFSASITTIGNVGPGFGEVSSMGNFSGLPAMGKFVLSLNMLMGRLELFSIMAFLTIRRNSVL